MNLSNNTFSTRKVRALVYKEKTGRKEAISKGICSYYSNKQCGCGSRIRFTTSNGCVICCAKSPSKEKLRAESVDMEKVKARRKIEDIKEGGDDYWDSLLED